MPPRAAPRRLLLSADESDPRDEWLYGPAFSDEPWSDQGVLANVVQVKRVDGERAVGCDAGELVLRRAESVLIETERGVDLAVVLAPPRREWLAQRPFGRVIRRASEHDLAQESRVRVRRAQAERVASDAVHELALPAKVVRAEVQPGQNRTVLYLASEERIDLRALGRTLTTALRGRVEIRHVGMRDAARVAGGIGPCGLQLCCKTFLSEFAPVSIRMAKDQGLALKPERVSGVCGRLMCCLVYEEAFYRAQRAQFPKHGKRVSTPRGEGIVRDVDVLARTVRVALTTGEHETFTVAEVRALPPPPRHATRDPAAESTAAPHDDEPREDDPSRDE